MSLPRIAILVPDPAETEYADRWPGNFAAYAAVLARAGLEAAPRPWTQGPDPAAALHLPLLAWGYHHDVDRWLAALDGWPEDAPLANGAALLSWNTRKTYLAELEGKGVATLPTVFLDRAGPDDLAAARARFGVEALVLKPQVSAGSHLTLRLRAGETATLGRPAMIQPFLPAVGGEGELSLFLFGGLLSHAIAKRATGGDFRVQPQFGADIGPIDPPADAVALAHAAVAACPAPPLYARVDMLRDDAGVLRLMELEAIEPDLYLEHAADGGAAFAQAVTEAVRAAT